VTGKQELVIPLFPALIVICKNLKEAQALHVSNFTGYNHSLLLLPFNSGDTRTHVKKLLRILSSSKPFGNLKDRASPCH
jgi:hypothetical protein